MSFFARGEEVPDTFSHRLVKLFVMWLQMKYQVPPPSHSKKLYFWQASRGLCHFPSDLVLRFSVLVLISIVRPSKKYQVPPPIKGVRYHPQSKVSSTPRRCPVPPQTKVSDTPRRCPVPLPNQRCPVPPKGVWYSRKVSGTVPSPTRGVRYP